MKCAYTAKDLIEAEILRDKLQDHGISSEIFNKNLSGVHPMIPNTQPKLMVADESLERARELIQEFLNENTKFIDFPDSEDPS